MLAESTTAIGVTPVRCPSTAGSTTWLSSGPMMAKKAAVSSNIDQPGSIAKLSSSGGQNAGDPSHIRDETQNARK